MSQPNRFSIIVYLPHILSHFFVREVAAPIAVDPQLADLIRKAGQSFTAQLSPQSLTKFNGRLERGLELALNGSVHPAPTPNQPHRYQVRSAEGNREYVVDLDARSCDCPDSLKGNHCKHRIAAYYFDQALQNRAHQPVNTPHDVTGKVTPPSKPVTTPSVAHPFVSISREDQILKELGFAPQPKKVAESAPQTVPEIRLGNLYSKYLHGDDLGDQSYPVTVVRLTREKVTPHPSQSPIEKWCLWVAGLPAGMPTGILFGSLGERELVAIFGKVDVASIQGKSLVIYPKPVSVGGQNRMAIHFKRAQ
jgi:hypothetical protein